MTNPSYPPAAPAPDVIASAPPVSAAPIDNTNSASIVQPTPGDAPAPPVTPVPSQDALAAQYAAFLAWQETEAGKNAAEAPFEPTEKDETDSGRAVIESDDKTTRITNLVTGAVTFIDHELVMHQGVHGLFLAISKLIGL